MKTKQKSVASLENELPYTMEFDGNPASFCKWFNANSRSMNEILCQVGAVNIKNVGVDTLEKFDTLIKDLYGSTDRYLDANSTRAQFTSNVHNASEYDSDSPIVLHTEYSYANKWPSFLMFCCVQKAEQGGETTVGDSRRILALLPPELVEEFERKEITYIRNLHGGNGLGPSWQEAFQTTDKTMLERHCKEYDINLRWTEAGARLEQTRPAVRLHKTTGEKIWFNQVDQYIPAIYGNEILASLLMMNGNDPKNLPMYATFGDGSEISESIGREIVSVLTRETIPVTWENGDLLLVENMISHHGRMPYKGARKVLVALV
jgi:hypothetical protein